MAGHSKRSLAGKLGLKTVMKMTVINPPENYFEMLGPLPEPVEALKKRVNGMDYIHFFAKTRAEHERKLIKLKRALAINGMLWVSGPKAASQVRADMSDNVVRKFGLGNGLVDVKVCAVDNIWPGLKLVIPLKDRKG